MAGTQLILGIVDYCIVFGFLGIYVGIGIYLTIRQRKSTSSTDGYLLADHKLGPFLLSMSYFATLVSPNLIIGMPAEIYVYGTQPSLRILWQTLLLPVSIYIIVPVFFNLNSCSTLTVVQLCISVLGISSTLSQVTGLGRFACAAITCFSCIFYTSLGGLKAVVWTDVVQGILMLISIVIILFLGSTKLGGMTTVWNSAWNGGRIEFFNLSTDPTIRHTIWTVMLGENFTFLMYQTCLQQNAQRVLASSSCQAAQISLCAGSLMRHSFEVCLVLIGLMIYKAYMLCDPMQMQGIPGNEILSKFMMDYFSMYPGFAGLFIAILSAAVLSTLSSMLNSLAAITMKDVLAPLLPNVSQKNWVILCKILVLIYGIIGIFGIYLNALITNVLQAAIAFNGAVLSSSSILILLGIFFPQINIKGLIISTLIGTSFTLWIAIGAIANNVRSIGKPLSIIGCNGTEPFSYINVTTTAVGNYGNSDVLSIYKTSHMWYSGILFCFICVLSLSITWILGPEKRQFQAHDLIAPIVKKLHLSLPKKLRKLFLCNVYEESCTAEMRILQKPLNKN